MTTADEVTAPYLHRFALIQDGPAFETPSSALVPVVSDGRAAILKVAMVREEEVGGRVMVWWDGRGAAPVYAHEGPAIVLARAQGSRSLERMAHRDTESDDAATRILCNAALRLHGVSGTPPDGVVGLESWFAEPFARAAERGGFFERAAAVARALLDDQREPVVLHGDVHHGNVLDFGDRGWLAIDPKHVTGDRAYDFANILCNPDETVALRPGRLERQLDIICDATGIARKPMLAWTVAYCGLSTAWTEGSGSSPGHALAVGLAAERLLA